ncbi:MAG: hypothetical protein AB1743_09985 [Actinomycetota bacterium]
MEKQNKRFFNHSSNLLSDERAFGIVEAMISMTIMSLVLIGLLGLLAISVQAVSSSKAETIATQILNESIEKIRALPYEAVGLPDGDPSGTLNAEETKTVAGTLFTIRYAVSWVDDSADGTSTADTNGTNDYKQVDVEVSWSEKGTIRATRASTYVKYKASQSEPPTVNFVFGDVDPNKTPPDGTIFGLDNSPYKSWFDNGTIPLKANATDPSGDLISMRFYISLITPEVGLYRFDPTDNYENPTCFWNPNARDVYGDLLWGEGTHEVVVEAWDLQGLRDAKSIYWIIDREPPKWTSPANLTAVPIASIQDGGGNGDEDGEHGGCHRHGGDGGNEDGDVVLGVRLSWQAAWDGTDKIEHYRIYRKGPGGEFTVLVQDLNAPLLTYDNSGLQEWSSYQYYITALSPGGRESTTTSNIASATTYFVIEGTAFKDERKNKVRINWHSPPEGITVHHYDVYRSGQKANASPISGSATQFTDDNRGVGLPDRTTYDYMVIAYNGSNQEINRSVTISVTTEH